MSQLWGLAAPVLAEAPGLEQDRGTGIKAGV